MIHVTISDEALEDLSEGYRFYERKESGLVNISTATFELISRD
jgi:hypothetical protein